MGLWTPLLVTAAAGVGGTGLGGLLATLFRRESGREASLLLSFAAGVMVSVSCFGLLTEAAAPGAMELVALGVFLGCGVTAGLNALLDRGQPSGGLVLAGLVMAAAIALHNVPEGMVIGASFIGGTVRQGWTMAAVIGLHNIPEGMAISAPMVAGGERRWRAAGALSAPGVCPGRCPSPISSARSRRPWGPAACAARTGRSPSPGSRWAAGPAGSSCGRQPPRGAMPLSPPT